MALVKCIKPLGNVITVGKSYEVISNTKRGIIAIKNDNNNTHVIMNTDYKTGSTTVDFFFKYFSMPKEDFVNYIGSTRGKKGTSENLGF